MKNIKILDSFFKEMEDVNAISMRFDRLSKEVSYMIGGNKIIATRSLNKHKIVAADLFQWLSTFESEDNDNIVVAHFKTSFIVKRCNNYNLREIGFDDLQLKLIDAGITRSNGLSIVSSSKYENIPFFLRGVCRRLKTLKPDLNISYVNGRVDSLDENSDVLFIEGQSIFKDHGEKIKDLVLSGIPVITGIVAGNSMFGLKKASQYIDVDTLGSFSFLNTLIHLKGVPLTCQKCSIDFKGFSKKDDERAVSLLYRLTRLEDSEDDLNLRFSGQGCENCNNGLFSEVMCSDIIVPDYNMMSFIAKNDFSNAWQSWRQYHADGIVGRRFEDHAFEKMKNGTLSPIIVEEYFEMLNIQVLLEDGVLTSDEVESLNPPD